MVPGRDALDRFALQRRHSAVGDEGTGGGATLVRGALQQQPGAGPAAANRPASARCPAASMVTANRSTRPSTSAGYEPAMSETSTSGGDCDTGQNALTVVPMSSRPSATITRVTPVGNDASASARPSTCAPAGCGPDCGARRPGTRRSVNE